MGLDEDVIEVAAIGIPNRKGGDNLIAFVVLKPDSVVSASKLEYGLQVLINKFLNPLFKLRKVFIHSIIIDTIPLSFHFSTSHFNSFQSQQQLTLI